MKPNIIMLMLDSTRADHIGCYGYERPTTPFLDTLAEDSVVYDRAYSSSIWTLPSCMSLFTGKHPSEHRVLDWDGNITDRTFMNNLREGGYSTHSISAHIGASDGFGLAGSFDTREEVENRSRDFLFPNDPVFEEMEERRKSNTYDSKGRRYLTAAKLALEERSLKSLPNFLYHQYQMFRQRNGHWTDNGADSILNQARDLVAAAESPYFLFLDFLEAHQPYRPPRGYIRQFLPDDVSVDEMNAVIDANHIGKTITGEPFDERERQILVGLYDATIRYLDEQIGSFYRFLEENGHAEDTVFVVLADHGDLFGEWNLWGHQGRIHNRLCHVPLLIRYPWADARREDGVTEVRQLFDHITTLGQGIDPGTDCVLKPHGEALTEYYGLDTQISITPWEEYDDATRSEWGSYQVSLVRDRQRLLHDVTGRTELYDLTSTPDEERNVISEHEEVAEELLERVHALVGRPEKNQRRYRSGGDPDSFDVNEDTADHLEDLGYI